MAKDHPNVAIYPPIAFAIAACAAWALQTFLPILLFPDPPWAAGRWIGLVILIASCTLAGAAILGFREADTPVSPHNTPRAIARGGPYRFTRNPMYLGLLGVLLSFTLLFSNPWALIATPLLWAVLHFGVVLREEAYLRDKFGADYEALLATTRRWI